MNVIEFESVDSTNKWCFANQELLDKDRPNLVTSRTQTSGRGREGRDWVSEPGGLYQSIGYLTDMDRVRVTDIPTICMVGAVAVCKVLEIQGIDAKIKWPNDIIFNGYKIGGILCELSGDLFVIGFGLNVNQKDFGSVKRPIFPPSSIFLQTNKILDIREIGTMIADIFNTYFYAWICSGFDTFHEMYEKYQILTGHTIELDNEFRGRYIGIKTNGNILIDNGEEEKDFSVGDVRTIGVAD